MPCRRPGGPPGDKVRTAATDNRAIDPTPQVEVNGQRRQNGNDTWLRLRAGRRL